MSEGRMGNEPRPSRGKRPRKGGFWFVVSYYLTTPIRGFEEWAERRRRRAESMRDVGFWTRIGRLVMWPVHLVAVAGASVGNFLVWWVRNTNARFLLQGLPAIVVALTVGAVTAVAYLTPTSALMTRYRRIASEASYEASQAMSRFEQSKSPEDEQKALDEFHRARVCYERLALLEGDPAELRYKLALAEDSIARLELAKEEKEYLPPARVVALMEDLAPETSPGYGPAHFWKARRFIEEKQQKKSEDIRRIERHLKNAIQSGLLSPGEEQLAHSYLASIYMQSNDPDRLIEHLQPLVEVRPDMRMLLAQTYNVKKQPDRARVEAQIARDYYAKRVAENPDNDEARLGLARALMLLEDFPNARKTLVEGHRPDNQAALRAALSQLYAAWLRSQSNNPQSNVLQQMALIQEALRMDPANGDVLRYLVAISKRTGPEGDQARTLLGKMLASGITPPVLHVILGMDAWNQGDYLSARRHLEQAQRQDRQMPEVVNNLAWLYANTEPKDLDRALAMASAVVQAAPNVPQFRDTRGQILAMKGQFMEALTELETALPGMPEDPEIHKTLALVYEKLAMPEIAGEHQRIHEALAKIPKGQRQVARGPLGPAAKSAPPERGASTEKAGGDQPRKGSPPTTAPPATAPSAETKAAPAAKGSPADSSKQASPAPAAKNAPTK